MKVILQVPFTVCTSRSDLEKTTIFQIATVLCMILVNLSAERCIL